MSVINNVLKAIYNVTWLSSSKTKWPRLVKSGVFSFLTKSFWVQESRSSFKGNTKILGLFVFLTVFNLIKIRGDS